MTGTLKWIYDQSLIIMQQKRSVGYHFPVQQLRDYVVEWLPVSVIHIKTLWEYALHSGRERNV